MDPHAELLARAFHADPAVRYLLPNAGRRARAMWFSFAAYLCYGRRYGQVDTTPAGAAIWLPGSAVPVSVARLLRCGFASAPLKLGLAALRRTYRFDLVIQALHDQAVSGPHLYLLVLGAYPPGRGEGKTLLRPGLERADRAGLPCYLETTAPRALLFYVRHGFRVVAESDVPRGPHLWGLLRPVDAM